MLYKAGLDAIALSTIVQPLVFGFLDLGFYGIRLRLLGDLQGYTVFTAQGRSFQGFMRI